MSRQDQIHSLVRIMVGGSACKREHYHVMKQGQNELDVVVGEDSRVWLGCAESLQRHSHARSRVSFIAKCVFGEMR